MSIQNPYDHALKILARTYPEEFLRLGFPEQTVHLLDTLANVELALEIDHVEQIRSGLLYIFAPLLPLLVRPINEEMLVEERELILTHEKDTNRQRTLLTTAILIAAQSKLFSSDFLWALFKEDTMDLDNSVIAKLFDRAYGEKLAAETQKLEQEFQEKLASERAAAAEAATVAVRREAELTMTQQWQELMFKVLEHRFTSVPVALVLLLQAVKPSQRSRVNDIILDSPDVDACLQAMRQLQAES
jgi:hypothetical protein